MTSGVLNTTNADGERRPGSKAAGAVGGVAPYVEPIVQNAQTSTLGEGSKDMMYV